MKRSIYLFTLLLILEACKHSTPKTFEKLANQQTQRCPVVIDEYITLDSVIYRPNLNVNQYYYTLTGIPDNISFVKHNQEYARQLIIDELKNEISMKRYKDFNTSLEYIYFSQKDGKEILRILITANEY